MILAFERVDMSDLCKSSPARVNLVLCRTKWREIRGLAKRQGLSGNALLRRWIDDALAREPISCPLAAPQEAPRTHSWSPDRELL